MKLYDFLTEQAAIDEAAMTPTEFDRAVEQGQAQGVLVGFEFEVHMPEATLDAAQPQVDNSAEQLKEFGNIIDQYFGNTDLQGLSPKDFDQYFEFRQPVNGYADMQSAGEAMSRERLVSIRKLFDQIPEKIRAKSLQKMAGNYRNNQIPANMSPVEQLDFFRQFGNRVYYDSNKREVEQLGSRIRVLSDNDWDELLSFVYAGRVVERDQISRTAAKISGDFLAYFDLKQPMNQIWRALDLDEWLQSDYDDMDEPPSGYKEAVDILVPALQNMTGRKVNVFRSYHQSKKNMSDWYIEPDGSLEANGLNDVSCEIVSPPMPAMEAVTALKNFYGLAQTLNLYTNSTTGLHINVSIPGRLDVLKLAVFLGDQYVLKYFGREDSRYAQSVLQRLQQHATSAIDVKTANKKTNAIGQPRTTVKIDMNKLSNIARDATRGHMDSISNNGKYFSFRHAGGNYLADLTGIYNSVGRFIRAMIIASDPTLYRQEYMTKLAKLVSGPENVVGRDAKDDQLINYLRTKGMPILVMDIQRYKKGRDMKRLAERGFHEATGYYWQPEYAQSMTITANSASAQAAIVNKFKNEDRKAQSQALPVSEFETVVMLPPNTTVLRKLLSTDYPPGVATISGDSGITVAFFLRRKEQLPPTDPRTQALIKKLLRNRFPKGKVKEATDPKFVGFMNQSLGNRVDTPGPDPLADAPDWYRDAPVHAFDTDSSWGRALFWGVGILKKLTPQQKAQLVQLGEIGVEDWLERLAVKQGMAAEYLHRRPETDQDDDDEDDDRYQFALEDIGECQDYLEEVFHDPSITSWLDLIKSDLGLEE
jgi:hypothetical protein